MEYLKITHLMVNPKTREAVRLDINGLQATERSVRTAEDKEGVTRVAEIEPELLSQLIHETVVLTGTEGPRNFLNLSIDPKPGFSSESLTVNLLGENEQNFSLQKPARPSKELSRVLTTLEIVRNKMRTPIPQKP